LTMMMKLALLALFVVGALASNEAKVSGGYRYSLLVSPNEDKVVGVTIYFLEENNNNYQEQSVPIEPQLVTGGTIPGLFCRPPGDGSRTGTCYKANNYSSIAFNIEFTNTTVRRIGDGRIGGGDIKGFFDSDAIFAVTVQSPSSDFPGIAGTAITVSWNLKNLYFGGNFLWWDDFSMDRRAAMAHDYPGANDAAIRTDALKQSRDSSIAGAAFLILLAIGVVAVLVILVLALLLGKRA